MAKVSVIVPVHNTELYLRACVASIAAQTLKDIEIILVENASTDGSAELCHELAAADDRIKVLHVKMGDLSNARNEGVKAANGEFVAFVDSDDTIDASMYEDMYSLAMKEGVDIVFCDYVKKYDYRSDRYVYSNDGSVLVADSDELLKLNFKDKMPQSACTMLCRKSLFDDISFPVKRYFEDTATTWKLIMASERCAHISRPYYHYYRHGGSIAHTPSFNVHYGHVLADMERVDYINSSESYSSEEKLELAAKPMALFYRHFRKMVSLARTEEEKQICLKCREWVLSVPGRHEMKNRYKRTRLMVRKFWKLFCLLERGGQL